MNKKDKASRRLSTEKSLNHKMDQRYPKIKIREVPYLVKEKIPRRNKPCPCGSGEKYKNCCLLKNKQSYIDISLYAKDNAEISS